MAIRTFENARNDWRVIENPAQAEGTAEATMAASINNNSMFRLRPYEKELYFEMSLGSVYESCGKDDIALSKYMNAKNIKLAENHPDAAFAYCGIGSVMFHIAEPAWALRAYLKAREIREERLGGDTVDTATVYNNLGCCMYVLERN